MREVIVGNLEWGFNSSDGEYTMSEYAFQATERYGGYQLTAEEDNILQKSSIWQFLTSGRSTYYKNIGDSYTVAGNLKEAEKILRNALQTTYRDSEKLDLFLSIGNNLAYQARYDEAVIAFESALKLGISLNNDEKINETYRAMGLASVKRGNYEIAEDYFQNSVDKADQLYQGAPNTQSEILVKSLLDLYDLYRATERTNLAEVILRQVNTLRNNHPRDSNNETNNYSTHSSPKTVNDRWAKEDKLGYDTFARTVATLITHDETQPPFTIGIKGAWGTGKSSIMKRIQHILDSEADLTQENKATQRNQESSSIITFAELFSLLKKKEQKITPIQPVESKLGKTYSIPPRATVWFNAWKYQNSEQIWAGLAHCIITQVTARMTPGDREKFWLLLNLKRTDVNTTRSNFTKKLIEEFAPKGLAFASLLLIQIFVTIAFSGIAQIYPPIVISTGITITGIADFFRSRAIKLSDSVSGEFKDIIKEPDYDGKVGFLHLVETDIREVLNLVAKPDKPLVIFIDDLDRCAPNKVAEIVEAINLFLAGDYPNCIFVIGMEPVMVASALEVENKKLIEQSKIFSLIEDQAPLGWRFMEKIIQLPLVIPTPTDEGVKNYVDYLTGSPIASSTINLQNRLESNEVILNYYLNEFEKDENISDVILRTENLLISRNIDRDLLIEASKRVYTRKFTDRDPAIKSIISSVVPIFEKNPRQLKRYINLFRFLSTLRYYISLDNSSKDISTQLPSDEDLGKYVTLCLRWPQAVDSIRTMCICEEEGIQKTLSLYSILKKKAQELELLSLKQSDTKWKKFLQDEGYDFGPWIRNHQFRLFLTSNGNLERYPKSGVW